MVCNHGKQQPWIPTTPQALIPPPPPPLPTNIRDTLLTCAGKERAAQQAAVMYVSCASLLAHHPAPEARHLRLRRTAYLMAAAAALEVHSTPGMMGAGSAGSLSLAARYGFPICMPLACHA